MIMAEQPTFDISIEVDPPYADEVDVELLAVVARTVLGRESVEPPADLGVWITNEEELHTLNRTFRDVDASTDVLSFGEEQDEESPFVQAPESVPHLGDVAISFPHVVRQAEEYGHSRQRELAYLLTHGILHLLGYDHEDPEDAQEMRSHEEAALTDLQITRGAGDADAAT
jgi:probable rRNA maturation factor